MSNYTLAGEIVLRDLFSESLEKLETGAAQAEQQVESLGAEVDQLGAGPSMQPLIDRLERLQTEAAAAGQSLDRMMKEAENPTAVTRVAQLESAIASIKAKAAGGIDLTVTDIDDFTRLNSELAHIKGGLAGVQSKAAGVRSAFSGMAGVLGGLGIAFGAQQVISTGIELVKLGANVKEVREAYGALSAAAGVNGDAMLDAVRKASFGAISEMDAMLIMNRAFLSQQDQLISSLPQIVTYAASAGDALGKSTLEVTQGITEALATGQLRSLREYGIDIAQTDALEAAEALGQETDAMKRQEIVAALLAEALEKMAQKQQLLGDASASAADQIDDFNVAWNEFKTAIGEELVDAGAVDLLNGITNRLRGDTELVKSATDARSSIQLYIAALYEVGQADAAVAASSKFQELLRAGSSGAQGMVDLRTELESILYPAGQLPVVLKDAGLALAFTADGMAAVAGTNVGNIPNFIALLNTMGDSGEEAALAMYTLQSQIASARQESSRFASDKDKFDAWQRSVEQLENKLLGLSGVLDATTITQMRNQGERDLAIMYNKMGDTTQFGMELMGAEYMDGWDAMISDTRKAHSEIERAQEQHMERLFDSAGGLRSAIEGALEGSMTVTDLDLQLTASGQYEDKVNEAARQLQAIAERGFSELQAHPDWASALKIPDDVLSGSEAQLKAWAGQAAQDVNNNLRPDLVNWDAFLANFQKGLEDKAAQDLTIDIAVGKLQEAGLLSQDTDALRQQIAEQLGIAAPTLTIDALFEAQEGAGAGLVKQVTGETGYVEVPAMLKYQQPATGEPGAEETGTGTQTIMMPPTAIPDQASATATGASTAQALVDSFSTALANTDVGAMALSAWSASFAAQTDNFKLIGDSLGDTMFGAFIGAMQSNMLGFSETVAGWIAPAVAAQLRLSTGSGSNRGAIE